MGREHMDDVKKFLVSTNSKLKSGKFTISSIVIGNPTCDLDSAVCAMVYACFLQWQHSLKEKEQNLQEEETDCVFVPILNVRREDLIMKTEVSFCFLEYGVTAEDLICRDDYDFAYLSRADTSVTLVDHHILADEDKHLQKYVREIFDHRPKDEKNWSYGENVRATIEQVGSCATLMCKQMRPDSEEDGFLASHPACVRLLLDTILLDTINLSVTLGKVTPMDKEQVTHLEEIMISCSCFRPMRLRRLLKARADYTHLQPQQILLKDLKVMDGVLMPSLPVSVNLVLSMPPMERALSVVARAKNCTLALLLGSWVELEWGEDEVVARDLAVWGRDVKEADLLAQWLERDDETNLGLSPRRSPVRNIFLYKQGNIAMSRKQIMLLMARYLNR